MIISHNIGAMFANRQLGITNGQQGKSMEKLSSGYKINRAADDAAGLSISEKMRKQIRGLTQATNNAQDGISFCQIADGALQEVHDMLDRCKELTIKAANGTMSASDRADIQNELKEIQNEIDRVHTTTKFNELDVFTDDGLQPTIYVDENGADEIRSNIKLGNINVEITAPYLGAGGSSPAAVTSTSGVSTSGNNNSMSEFIVKAASDAVSKLATAYPTLFSTSSSQNVKIGLELGNIDGASGTLAFARFGASYIPGGNTTNISYTLKVDTSDYDPAQFDSYSAEKKADLAATIAHEMTHLVMDDTLTSGMLPGNKESFPKWFKEGTAQTSSGDNGWVSHRITPSSSDASIKNYMSQLLTMEYGAGYLAAMYLGYAASGSSTVNSDSIKQGLDKIFTDVANGKLLSDAIKDNTSYSGLGDFENKFMKGEGKELAFVKQLLNARGTSGAGSLLADSLSTSEAAAFSSLSGSYGSYNIDKNYSEVKNSYDQGWKNLTPGSIYMGDDADNEAGFSIQAGADNLEDNRIKLNRYNLSSARLFYYDSPEEQGDSAGSVSSAVLDVSTIEGARKGIDQVDMANKRVSAIRSYYGAMQNRMEHTIKNLDNVVENTTSSESKLRDTDMAREMVEFSKNNILAQAGQSMLAQANASTNGVLSLLQ